MLSTIWQYFWKTNIEESPNIGEDLRKVVQSKNFENKMIFASPFLIGNVIAWPAFWLYKGVTWPSKRGIESLQVYIRKTFFQAKLIQLAIIATGLIITISQDTPQNVFYTHNDI